MKKTLFIAVIATLIFFSVLIISPIQDSKNVNNAIGKNIQSTAFATPNAISEGNYSKTSEKQLIVMSGSTIRLNTYKPEKNSTNIYFGGDLMFSRTVGALSKTNGYSRVFGSYNPGENANSGSLMFFNLESPFTKNDKDVFKRTFSFGANIKNIEQLKKLKGDNDMVLSLANNHILNSGVEGLKTTIALLEANSITHLGVRKDADEYFYKKINVNGSNVCINAYTYDGRSYTVGKTIWNVRPLEKSIKDVKRMKTDKSCDYAVVSLHWGNEYTVEPTIQQKKLAEELIDAEADLIIGGHSHVFGKIENIKNKDVFYSMGNYVFDRNWGMDGCQKNMVCVRDSKLKKKTVPTYIGTGINYDLATGKYKMENFRINNGKLGKY